MANPLAREVHGDLCSCHSRCLRGLVLIVPLRGHGIKSMFAPHHHHKFSRIVVSGGRRLYRGSPQDDDEKLEIELKYPDVLFVPSGSIYSWSCTSESILGEEQGKNTIPVVVMTHGFVDAGALSHFINELALDAAQDAEAYSPGILESVFSMYGGNVPFKQLAPSNARALPALLPWRNLKGIADSGYQDDTQSEKFRPRRNRKSAHREWRTRKLWNASFLHSTPRPNNLRVIYSGWEIVQLEIDLPFGPSSTFASLHKGFQLRGPYEQRDPNSLSKRNRFS